MRFNVHSPHWADGGTGITNFGLSSLALYDEAVRRYVAKTGDRSYIVCDVAMAGNYIAQEVKDTMGSLHRADAARLDGHNCSEFWNIFHATKQEINAKEDAEKARTDAVLAQNARIVEEQQREAARARKRAELARDMAKAAEKLALEDEQRVREARIERTRRSMLDVITKEQRKVGDKVRVRVGNWEVTLQVDIEGKLHYRAEKA